MEDIRKNDVQIHTHYSFRVLPLRIVILNKEEKEMEDIGKNVVQFYTFKKKKKLPLKNNNYTHLKQG